MYLAQRVIDGCLHYTISRSYQEDGWWQSEDLIDLGAVPASFLTRAEQGGFAVEARIWEELCQRGAKPEPGELEELFSPFAPTHLREIRQRWWQRRKRRPPRRLIRTERERLEAQIPLFDRRRFCYLKTGATDLAAISILPIQSFLPLADKSRDEIEQDLLFREQQLDPAGHGRYLFAVFNLRHWFIYLEARSMPQEMDCAYLDQIFFEELCRINANPRFWMQENPSQWLHPYLVRYATMFFDADWSWEAFRDDERRHFRDHFRRPRPQGEGADAQTEDLFGVSMAELRDLSRRELTHLYKRRALQFHPDHGGDPAKFVLLTQAYESLLKEREG
jgi:hypothetical protein